jgi:hypothetical protein
MMEWEKENQISFKEKRKKTKKKKSKHKSRDKWNRSEANKENQIAVDVRNEETVKGKESRLQKVADMKIDNWIEGGFKESWLSFKTK